MRENFATLLEVVADVRGERVAIVRGDVRRTWRELDDRAARLARHLRERGVRQGGRVAMSLYNGPEYLETLLAVLKLRAAPVNVNYRYHAREIGELLSDSGATAFVVDAALSGDVAGALATLDASPAASSAGAGPAAARPEAGTAGRRPPAIVRLGAVDGPDPLAGRASDYATAISSAEPLPPEPRSGDDEWLMFTGGTTGRPKGVRNRQTELYGIGSGNGYAIRGVTPPADLDELREVTRRLTEGPDRLVTLVAPPLIHATGLYTALGTLLTAGTVVFLTSRTYDPDELASLAERHEVTNMCLVGDVFAAPFADALDRARAAGRPYRLDAVREIRSVGVTWSPGVKRRLLDHLDVRLVDVIAASEGGPFAAAVTTRSAGEITSTFELMPGARVLGDDDRDVRPGEVGRLAAPCADDAAYLGDPDRTATTFRLVDGVRHTVPGDLATIRDDGTLVLLGRDSRVINTGGEKVFAEEVEQVIATHPQVADVVVLGLPDPHWGHRVTALVAPTPGATLTQSDIQSQVSAELAGYKKPRTVVFTPRIPRTPAGKLDLRQARSLAENP